MDNKNNSGFVTASDEVSGSAPQKVIGAIKLDTYLVQYVDGAGKTCVRVAFAPEKSQEAYIIPERIQGSSLVVAAHAWFNKQFFEFIGRLKPKSSSHLDVESV